MKCGLCKNQLPRSRRGHRLCITFFTFWKADAHHWCISRLRKGEKKASRWWERSLEATIRHRDPLLDTPLRDSGFVELNES